MKGRTFAVLQRIIDLPVLMTLGTGEMSGCAIARRIKPVPQHFLYLTLRGLQAEGLVLQHRHSRMRASHKYFRLSKQGRKMAIRPRFAWRFEQRFPSSRISL